MVLQRVTYFRASVCQTSRSIAAMHKGHSNIGAHESALKLAYQIDF
jgi:hypothetical protein